MAHNLATDRGAEPRTARPATSNEERQILREQDALVEDDHAPGDLPRAVDPAQHVLALAHEQVGLRLDAISVDEKATPKGNLRRLRRP